MSDKKPLCIYHGSCFDGFTAAWAVWKRFGDTFDYHAGVYGDAPPDVTGRRVYIVDFSYKYDVLVEMSFKAKSLIVLDHHKTAAEDLARLPIVYDRDETELEQTCWSQNMPVVGAVFDMERSGAGIAWDYFHPAQLRPAFVNHVEDRDLWRFALEGTREVHAAMSSRPFTFEAWEEIAATPIPDLIVEGRAIDRKHRRDIETLVPIHKRDMIIGGHRVPVANLPMTMTSDAGHLMCQQWNGDLEQDSVTAAPPLFAACYWDTPKARVFSLRSVGDFDVSEIAKQYGGGGHKNAAGFRLPHGVEP